MIEINLLPQEVKSKNKTLAFKQAYFLYLLAFVFCGLIFAHIALAAWGLVKGCQLRLLENKWKQLTPQRKMMEGSKGSAGSSATSAAAQKLFEERICWSEKLNKLSLSLPEGVWFNEISLNQNSFVLKGAVISLKKEEMALINAFLDSLKQDKDFIRDFSILEIDVAMRKIIGGYEIIEFNLCGSLK